MAGANVTGGVITGGDGADGGGGGEVVGVAAIVGGGEAVGVGDAAGGEDVDAGVADWASLVGKKAVMPLSQDGDGDRDIWIGGAGGDES
jgi:hypothetical protein